MTTTQRQRIIKGQIPASIADEVSERQVAVWQGLTDGQRAWHYEGAKADHRHAHAMENGFISNKLGQGTAQGRFGCLVMAIESAWNASPECRAEAQARREAMEDELMDCKRCDGQHARRDSLIMGSSSMGLMHLTDAERSFLRL